MVYQDPIEDTTVPDSYLKMMPPPPAPPKKKHILRNIILGILGLGFISSLAQSCGESELGNDTVISQPTMPEDITGIGSPSPEYTEGIPADEPVSDEGDSEDKLEVEEPSEEHISDRWAAGLSECSTEYFMPDGFPNWLCHIENISFGANAAGNTVAIRFDAPYNVPQLESIAAAVRATALTNEGILVNSVTLFSRDTSANVSF